MNKPSFRVRFKYWFDNYVSKGPVAMINGLGIFTFVMVLIFATTLWLSRLHPNNDNNFNIFHSIWVNMTHVLDPGTVGNHEDNWPFQLFMMTVTIVGLVVVSTLIGLVSSGILDKIEELSASVRYRHEPKDCKVVSQSNGKVEVQFKEEQRAVTPGQSIVFYNNDVCLGGGIIG